MSDLGISPCLTCGRPTTLGTCHTCAGTEFVPYISESVKQQKLADSVNHPSHYTFGKFEVIDVIEDWKLDYHRGNAVKYIARAGKKDPSKTIEDLSKAKWYLERAIERLKNGTTD